MRVFISLNEFQCAFCESTEMCFIKGSPGEALWDSSLPPSCPSLLGKTESQRNVSPTSCTQQQSSDALHASPQRSAGKRTNFRLISHQGGSNVRYDDQHGARQRRPHTMLRARLIFFSFPGPVGGSHAFIFCSKHSSQLFCHQTIHVLSCHLCSSLHLCPMYVALVRDA